MNEKIQLEAENFVRVWQTSKSLIEAASRLNRSRQAAHQKSFIYRSNGVPLKLMSQQDGRHSRLDWNKLKELAEKTS
ncbi:MAG: hypothetical protein QME66_05865 [Candidatus Eisenbacteria bacterium]|nr:hypothetical protein [Candidatus Eisenbacteria bacterium]